MLFWPFVIQQGPSVAIALLRVFGEEDFVEEDIVVSGYEDFVGMRLGGELAELILDFIKTAIFCQVSCMDKDVAIRGLWLSVVCQKCILSERTWQMAS